MTHTFAVLPVTKPTFNEIKKKLNDAGYDHCLIGGGKGSPLKIDMSGIALAIEDMPQTAEQVTAEKMRIIGMKIQEEAPGLGFALFIFEFYKPGMSNYISNARREDMVIALEETLERFRNGQDFPTPEGN